VSDQPYLCMLCGDEVQPGHYASKLDKRLRDRSLCFTCDFWEERIAYHEEHPDRSLIVRGTAYTIGDEPSTAALRRAPLAYGSGGREFQVQFFDGRVVVSHNLWYQGRVPEHLRERAPDNARFLSRWGAAS
jgi:hypothetical protein